MVKKYVRGIVFFVEGKKKVDFQKIGSPLTYFMTNPLPKKLSKHSSYKLKEGLNSINTFLRKYPYYSPEVSKFIRKAFMFYFYKISKIKEAF